MVNCGIHFNEVILLGRYKSAGEFVAEGHWHSYGGQGWAHVPTLPRARWVLGFAKIRRVFGGSGGARGGRVTSVLHCSENAFIDCRLCVYLAFTPTPPPSGPLGLHHWPKTTESKGRIPSYANSGEI